MGRRFRLDLTYDGTGFEGWQVQPGRRTVQGELMRCLTRLGESERPTGAGRTDAGVHALGQVAHVDLERDWDPEELVRAVRGHCPGDLHCLRAAPVAGSFHARYRAQTRTYHYALGMTHNPFFRHRRWVVGRFPDDQWAREELDNLMGENDFASFAKSGGGSASTICRVADASMTRFPGGAVVSVTADRFVYGMVRAIVGTLMRESARGAAPGVFPRILAARDRGAAGEAAPPGGLYLAQVRYPEDPPVEPDPAGVARLAGIDGFEVAGVLPGGHP